MKWINKALECEKCEKKDTMVEEIYNSMFYLYRCNNCGFVSTNIEREGRRQNKMNIQEVIKELEIMGDKECQRCHKTLKHDAKATEVLYCHICDGLYCKECWLIQRNEEQISTK